MKNIIKKSKKIMFLSIFLVCVCFITGCASEESSARQRITEITNIEVPNNSCMVYHHDDDVFIHGRVPQYSVFEFEEHPMVFLDECNFQDGKSKHFENNYAQSISFMTIEVADIPSKYLPNWDNDYQYLLLDESNAFFIYFTEKQILIVFIESR